MTTLVLTPQQRDLLQLQEELRATPALTDADRWRISAPLVRLLRGAGLPGRVLVGAGKCERPIGTVFDFVQTSGKEREEAIQSAYLDRTPEPDPACLVEQTEGDDAS